MINFQFAYTLYRDTRNVHKLMYRDGKNRAPAIAGQAPLPCTRTISRLKYQDPARMLRQVTQRLRGSRAVSLNEMPH